MSFDASAVSALSLFYGMDEITMFIVIKHPSIVLLVRAKTPPEIPLTEKQTPTSHFPGGKTSD